MHSVCGSDVPTCQVSVPSGTSLQCIAYVEQMFPLVRSVYQVIQQGLQCIAYVEQLFTVVRSLYQVVQQAYNA